jgi:hypothetical protein
MRSAQYPEIRARLAAMTQPQRMAAINADIVAAPKAKRFGGFHDVEPAPSLQTVFDSVGLGVTMVNPYRWEDKGRDVGRVRRPDHRKNGRGLVLVWQG